MMCRFVPRPICLPRARKKSVSSADGRYLAAPVAACIALVLFAASARKENGGGGSGWNYLNVSRKPERKPLWRLLNRWLFNGRFDIGVMTAWMHGRR